MAHLNDRGSHTTVIDEAKEVLRLLKKAKISVAPGVIIGSGGSRSKSVKLRKLNNETFEMVIVVKSVKQLFKIFVKKEQQVLNELVSLRNKGWIIPEVMDVSMAE